jgi:2-polyprenyl-3-methyl-5-hydroxy-6-metoxy-1,4-benzoquinol methylase
MNIPELAELTYSETKARQSLGCSNDAIYRMVAAALDSRQIMGDTVIDVGCGTGALRNHLGDRFRRYIGVDIVRYDGFPDGADFLQVDLDFKMIDLPPSFGDVVIAVETIEHLENPRAFFRELTRLAKPNGYVVVTTPNQLSLLSLFTLMVKKRRIHVADVEVLIRD